jgi:hypothetical protein
MVTAILPTMTQHSSPKPGIDTTESNPSNQPERPLSLSISSELTITPARRNAAGLVRVAGPSDPSASSSRLAGFVGMFTGLGALVALFGFLPLPKRFSEAGSSLSEAVAQSFYVVGAVAFATACLCFWGLRNLESDQGKSLKRILQLGRRPKVVDENEIIIPTGLSYPKLLLKALTLGVQDVDIGLAYIGGFVARASSVAISLFIPLFVNLHFISSGKCPANPDGSLLDPGQIKKNCQRAYIVSSILTGVSQLTALLCAPLFGYLTARFRRINLPLLIGACAGVAGYISFGLVKTPDPHSSEGNIELYFIVILIGVSQISAIVCSLGILSRGIQKETDATCTTNVVGEFSGNTGYETEADPLIASENQSQDSLTKKEVSRSELKGSIAGIYSFAGGAGILLLTKVGGLLFDRTDPGSPFFIMAGFNAMLMIVGAFCALLNAIRH